MPRKKMVITPELKEKLDKLTSAYLDKHGREVCCPKPAFLEVTPERLSLREQIQRILRTEVSLQAMQQGKESFEESQDFDVGDIGEETISSSYEMTEESPEVFEMPSVSEAQEALEAHKKLQKERIKDELGIESAESDEPSVGDGPSDA